jgi:amylosucrase
VPALIETSKDGWIAARLRDRLDPQTATVLLSRLESAWPVTLAALEPLYAGDPRWPEARVRLIAILAAAVAARSPALRDLDQRRIAQPYWFQNPKMVGYSTYVDRFAGNLNGVSDRIGYLQDLGVNVLHLLPIMRVRDGNNDGGFAMESHTEVDPRWGANADLEALADRLRESGISLTLDLLCNHTASTHPWARAALAGDPRYSDHYLFFDSEEETRAFGDHLDQVFPETAPGNFSKIEGSDRWVWTTFYPYQWDLNFRNPDVFADMLEAMLAVANMGAETLRLDSVAYLWKQAGTSCKNLPQTHALLQAFSALISAAAPAVLLKAEAIVEASRTTEYLGQAGGPPECQIAYNNPLMLGLWSAIADGAASELVDVFDRLPAKPAHASWINYVRCHDDIGWALLAKERGKAGQARAAFLADFYSGREPGSWAKGDLFQSTMTAHVHGGVGMTASMAGLEAALLAGDQAGEGLALARILLLHAVLAACPGTPTLWMGDEIGLMSARSLPAGTWAAEDARRQNRPFLDWQAAAMRLNGNSIEGRLFAGIKKILAVRAATPAFHASNPVEAPLAPHSDVLVFKRGQGGVTVVANFGARHVQLDLTQFCEEGVQDRLGNCAVSPGGKLELAPYACAWLSVTASA